jgi:hypothetical protein
VDVAVVGASIVATIEVLASSVGGDVVDGVGCGCAGVDLHRARFNAVGHRKRFSG